jgi:hypothetical protein
MRASTFEICGGQACARSDLDASQLCRRAQRLAEGAVRFVLANSLPLTLRLWHRGTGLIRAP